MGGLTLDEIRDHCLFGAAMGSLIAILHLKVDKKTGLPIAFFQARYSVVLATFVFNGAFAFLASPVLCDVLLPWHGIEKTQNACVAMSGAIAIGCPWLFRSFFPIAGEKATQILRALQPTTIIETLAALVSKQKDRDK